MTNDVDTNSMHPLYARAEELMREKEIQRTGRDTYEVLRVASGERGLSTQDEVTRTIAMHVAILESKPEVDSTANTGGVSVVRQPLSGYHVMVWSGTIPDMSLLTSMRARRGVFDE